MSYADDMEAYWNGYNGIPINPADPGFGHWLRGKNDRLRAEQDRDDTYEFPPPQRRRPVPAGPDDPSPTEYVALLIVGPTVVGLTALVITLLAGGDYMKWAAISSAATFAILLVWGALMVWEIIVGWAIIVGIVWWVLHLLGIVPGLPW